MKFYRIPRKFLDRYHYLLEKEGNYYFIEDNTDHIYIDKIVNGKYQIEIIEEGLSESNVVKDMDKVLLNKETLIEIDISQLYKYLVSDIKEFREKVKKII